MSYQLTLHLKRAYLHAVVTGENTRDNVAGYLQDLRRECPVRLFGTVAEAEKWLENPWPR
jgi:hypothetical protein